MKLARRSIYYGETCQIVWTHHTIWLRSSFRLLAVSDLLAVCHLVAYPWRYFWRVPSPPHSHGPFSFPWFCWLGGLVFVFLFLVSGSGACVFSILSTSYCLAQVFQVLRCLRPAGDFSCFRIPLEVHSEIPNSSLPLVHILPGNLPETSRGTNKMLRRMLDTWSTTLGWPWEGLFLPKTQWC